MVDSCGGSSEANRDDVGLFWAQISKIRCGKRGKCGRNLVGDGEDHTVSKSTIFFLQRCLGMSMAIKVVNKRQLCVDQLGLKGNQLQLQHVIISGLSLVYDLLDGGLEHGLFSIYWE